MLLQLGVFLLSLSGLLFEIALTRIFSATLWYHFAFVAVSTALLGWGLGGLSLHLLRGRLRPSLDTAAVLSLVYAAAVPCSLWVIVRVTAHPEQIPLAFAAAVVPFLLGGAVLAMVFDLRRAVAGRLYFADLLGASLGAAAVGVLLGWLGGERTVILAAAAPVLAALCLSPRVATAAGALVVGSGLLFAARDNAAAVRIRSSQAKGMFRHLAADPALRVDLTGWNAYSRIDSVTGFPPPFLARLYIDADAWTNIHAWDGRVESLAHWRNWFRALPFSLTPSRDVLVIGPGGGADVMVALGAGAEKVTAVELNPLVLSFVRHYGAAAGNLYDHPRVETVLAEGRNYLSRTDRRFDVIFLGFVDSWAAVASGGLSLSENYLYTTDALRAYDSHLTDDGVLVIARWDVDIPRLVANAAAVLGPETASRVAVLREPRGHHDSPPQVLFVMKHRPFTEADLARLGGDPGVAVPVVLGGRSQQPYLDLLTGRTDLAGYVRQAEGKSDPVSDDRPFFFARERPFGVPRPMLSAFALVLAPVVAVSVLLVLWGRPREGGGPYGASIVYFSCLGLGFIAVELACLQYLTMLLGHPIFTLSVLLFALLASGGLGSRASGRFSMTTICLVVAALGALYGLALPRVVPALLPLPFAARVAVAIALVAPLGFAMGMPFPRGLRATGQGVLPAPPFYWGLNGVMSVIGSVATVLVAVTWGFRAAMLAGSVCYLGAALASRALPALAAEVDEEAA